MNVLLLLEGKRQSFITQEGYFSGIDVAPSSLNVQSQVFLKISSENSPIFDGSKAGSDGFKRIHGQYKRMVQADFSKIVC